MYSTQVYTGEITDTTDMEQYLFRSASSNTVSRLNSYLSVSGAPFLEKLPSPVLLAQLRFLHPRGFLTVKALGVGV